MKKLLDDPSRNRGRLLFFIGVAVVLVAVLVSLFRDMGVVSLMKLRNTEQQLRAEVELLRQENAELKNQVEGLRNNPAVIEDEARRIGLVRDKEKVIVVPPSQDSSRARNAPRR